jgi:hypothetical protein
MLALFMDNSHLKKYGFNRPDWLAGKVHSHGVAVAIFYFCFGLISSIVITSIALPFFPRTFEDSYAIFYTSIAILVMILAGPIPLIVGFLQIVRVIIWGRPIVVFRKIPLIGQSLEFEVHVPTAMTNIKEINASLSCRTVKEYAIKNSARIYFDRIVGVFSSASVEYILNAHETVITTHFTLPADIPRSTSQESEPRWGHFWILELKVKGKWPSFKARFSVPVI